MPALLLTQMRPSLLKAVTPSQLSHEIRPTCCQRATALSAGNHYGGNILAVEERVPAMVAYVMSEGRLFWLKPSEWLLLLVSAAICGFLTLLL
jgi:hypothetical protein